jgi:hypothetical protein
MPKRNINTRTLTLMHGARADMSYNPALGLLTLAVVERDGTRRLQAFYTSPRANDAPPSPRR